VTAPITAISWAALLRDGAPLVDLAAISSKFMAGFRRPGPLGIGELVLPAARLGVPPGFSSASPLGVETPATTTAASSLAGEPELPSFRLGGQRYRIHDPKHGAIPGDEAVVTGNEAQQVLDEAGRHPDLSGVIEPIRQAVTGRGLILLRMRAPASGGTTAPAPEPAPPPRAPPRKETKSWIEIEVVDDDGKPVEGYGYRLDLPDGRTMQGKLGGKGIVSVHGIDPGSATLTLVE
jgi:hypothetical protein